MSLSALLRSNQKSLNAVEQKNLSQKRKIVKNLFLFDALANTDLSTSVKLSTPKLISLLNELKEDGLVEELGQGSSSGGRRPNLYGNVADAFYIVAVSIGLYKTIVSVFNAKNQKITEDWVLQIRISQSISIVDPIVDFVHKLISECNIPLEKIIGVGIEMPGMVNSETGINKTYMVSDVPLAKLFRQKLGLQVLIENDAKSRAFAELRFGAARSKRNVLAIHLDWGIGLGIIVNGKLYKGRDGFAGEFGHIPIVENGILCQCGKLGCLETIASGTAIDRLAREGIRNAKSTFLRKMLENETDKIEIRHVVQAALMGDQYSISVLASVGSNLGKGISYLIQIFNPERIILGGRISEGYQFILPPIQQAIQAFCNPDLGNEIDIVSSELGSQSGIQGVACLVLEQELDKN